MSRAAADLVNGKRVSDVALRYGYESPAAFNRAFQSVHGRTPSALKNNPGTVKSFMPIRFVTIKGAEVMDFKIVKKDAFRVVGVVENIYQDMEKNFTVIPALWDRLSKDGTLNKIAGLIRGDPAAVLGISFCNDNEPWKYAIAVPNENDVDEQLTESIVPAATWAIFSGEGTNKSIQDLIMRVHTEWLPASGYVFANAPEVEVYYCADPDNAQYALWVPVVCKK